MATVIKTVDDLRKLKEKLVKQTEIREKGSASDVMVQVKVAMATCGIASGAKPIMDYFSDELGKRGIRSMIIPTGCMGYCYAEPTIEVRVPGKEPLIFGNVDTDKANEIIERYIKKGELVDGIIPVTYQSITDSKEMSAEQNQIRIALRNCGFINPESIDDAIACEAYMALGKCLKEMKPLEVIDLIKKSGLRGRGGAGFSTGLKWELASKNNADIKYVVCNADEGDPGAFMDRSVLEGDPHSVLEAMAICGYSIGATKGLIYVRAEYPLAIQRLKIAMKQAHENGLLGKNIFGTDFSFEIELKYGAGAFVCGEETALIHSMEGHRGEPTLKPPFPAEAGYMQKPTNVNNVETLANIPAIILKGAEWFAKIGTEKSKGTKVFALAGKINNVGLIEIPMGTSLRRVIYEIGGGIKGDKKFKAVQTGGPSGGCLTTKSLDMPIEYETLVAAGSMMGSGGMIVLDETDCMVAIAKYFLEFTVEESCGKCAPCRIGNKRLYEILDKIISGNGTMDDLEKLRNLSQVIKDTSLCGLGQSSPNPVLSTLDNFMDEYIAHVKDHKCPSGQCKAFLKYYVIEENCVGCTACARNCPVNAIVGERKMPHTIDTLKCIKCGACIEKCKFDAIVVQ